MSAVQEQEVKPKPRGPHFRVTEKEKEKYIELVRAGVSKGDASQMLGRVKTTFSEQARKDADFKARVEEAWFEGADVLIEEAQRRGAEGWEEPVYQKGELVGYVRKYDSNLLMFSIKGRRPEYKENPRIDLTQNNLALNFEDRSANISDMWRVLDAAGVNAKELSATKVPGVIDGSITPKQLMAAVEGTVAEPSDL